MGIFTHEGHRNLRAAEQNVSQGIASLYSSICGICATLLEPSGRCPGCGRTFSPPPLNLAIMTDSQRAAAIRDGLVPAGTEGLSQNEVRTVQFYARLRRQRAEREQAATPKPKVESRESSLAERAKKFIRPDGSIIEMSLP